MEEWKLLSLRYYADCVSTTLTVLILHNVESVHFFYSNPIYGRAREATDENIIGRMRFVCWITKARDTLPESVIIIAIPREQLLRERASLLRHTYTACLVILSSHPRLCSFQITYKTLVCILFLSYVAYPTTLVSCSLSWYYNKPNIWRGMKSM